MVQGRGNLLRDPGLPCRTGAGRYPRLGWVPAFAGKTADYNQAWICPS
jgi:hypothetical protein